MDFFTLTLAIVTNLQKVQKRKESAPKAAKAAKLRIKKLSKRLNIFNTLKRVK